MRARTKNKISFLIVLGIIVFVTTNLLGSNVTYSMFFNQSGSLKSSRALTLNAFNQSTTSKTISGIFIANEAYGKLYERAVSLDTSKLQNCRINKTKVYRTQSGILDIKNDKKTYQLIVPDWQKRPRKESYFLSAIVRLRLYKEDKAKWTIAELKQWIHYQLWAGAEHVYICCHYLKEEEKLTDELDNYKQAGLVTVLDWNRIEAKPGSPNYQKQNTANQVGCYKHVKTTWGHKSKWMYSFDMDENPFWPKDLCEGFLTRYLKDPVNSENVGAFYLPNYVLEGQGDRSRDIHYDRINRISPKPFNGNVKTLFRANWTSEPGMHHVKLKEGKLVYPTNIKLLHYWGGRSQNWGPDTESTISRTVEFNDVRYSIAIAIRHSLLAFGDFDAFSNSTGP